MSSYDDTPQISALYQEQAQVNQALEILSTGGTVPSFVVAPPVPEPGQPMTSSLMAVNISTIDPSEALLKAAFEVLTDRYDEISQELQELGVTDTPPPSTRTLNTSPRRSPRANNR